MGCLYAVQVLIVPLTESESEVLNTAVAQLRSIERQLSDLSNMVGTIATANDIDQTVLQARLELGVASVIEAAEDLQSKITELEQIESVHGDEDDE